MSLINVSEATYCSEVENLIKVCPQVTVRRSLRLSQKTVGQEKFSWNNVHIRQNGSVIKVNRKSPHPSSGKFAKNLGDMSNCAPNIFYVPELSEEQEDVKPQLNCLKMAINDVPFDLTNKSKVSSKQTSAGELDIFTGPQHLKTERTENSAEKTSETVKDNLKQKKKLGRPKKLRTDEIYSNDCTKSIKNTTILSNDSLKLKLQNSIDSKTNKKSRKAAAKNINSSDLNLKSKYISGSVFDAKTKPIEKSDTIVDAIRELPLNSFKRSCGTIVLNKSNQLEKLQTSVDSETKTKPRKAAAKNINSSKYKKEPIEKCDTIVDVTRKCHLISRKRSCETLVPNKNNLLKKLQTSVNPETKRKPTKKAAAKNINSSNSQVDCNLKSKYISGCVFDAKTEPMEKPDTMVNATREWPSNSLKRSCETIVPNKNNQLEKCQLDHIPPTPADSTQEHWKKSLLPVNYPPHFKYQLPPEASLTHSSNEQFQPINVITPDDTTLDTELLESSSSSPSLPESLCELFERKNIKDILNVDRVSYRLYDYHVQALSLMLNLNLELLHKTLNKVMKYKPTVLKNIDKAVKMPFKPDCDLFAASPEESWACGEFALKGKVQRNVEFR